MTAEAAIALVSQLIALFPAVEPAIVAAVNEFKALFAGGATPTQAQIDALFDKIRTQSAQIQAL